MNISFVFIFLVFKIAATFNPDDILKIALQDDDDDIGQATKILGTATGLLTSALDDQYGARGDAISPLSILKTFNSRLSKNRKTESSEEKKRDGGSLVDQLSSGGDDFSPLSILGMMSSRLSKNRRTGVDQLSSGGDDFSPLSILEMVNSRLSKTRKTAVKEVEEKKRNSGLDGQHVCVNEINEIEPEESSGHEDDSHDSCDLYREAKVCTSRSRKGKTTKRIQYCCDGYTTESIEENGCLTEVSDELLFTYNVSRADAPSNSTLLFTTLESSSFILPGVQSSYNWSDKQILQTANNQKFVVTKTSNVFLTEIYLNCALKKETIRLGTSQILKLEGPLEPAAESLLEIIEKRPELTTFNKILGAELRTFLREINAATVFAFTNSAFDALPNATKNQILNADDNDCVQDILKHHISTTGAYCSNLPRHLQSLNDETLTCRHNGSEIRVDDALITSPSNYALNGVVHIIDTVLMRENYLSWRDSLRLFNTEVADQLENKTLTFPVTIFVPPSSNDTEIDDINSLLVSGQLIDDFKDVKSIHTDANSTIFTVSPSTSRSDSFSLRISMSSFSSSPKNVQIGCSKLTASSIHACKTIIHFLDKPLPRVTGTVEQYIGKRRDLSMFAKFWRRANFTTLPDQRITVFAPMDDAFSANLAKKIMKTEKSALAFIQRHVVKEVICGSDVRQTSLRKIRATTWNAMNNQLLTITDDDEINGAHIEEFELIQSNGVVHILESLIEPAVIGDNDARISPQQIVRNPLNIFSHIFG